MELFLDGVDARYILRLAESALEALLEIFKKRGHGGLVRLSVL